MMPRRFSRAPRLRAKRRCPRASPRVRSIATDEAFATPKLVAAWFEIARRDPASSLDVPTLILSRFENPRPGSNQDRFRRQLLGIDGERLSEMVAAGVDFQLLSVTIPGVQMFDPDRVTALAEATNDYLAAAIARNPERESFDDTAGRTHRELGARDSTPETSSKRARDATDARSQARLRGTGTSRG